MKARQTRYRVMFVCCWGPVVAAQTLAGPARRPELEHIFQSAAHARRLSCNIREIPPMLDYGMRFQTGYVATAPLEQFGAAPHRLTVYLRVTPKGREPVYFSTSGDVPRATSSKVDAEVRGGVVAGEGSYSIAALMEDDAGRACMSRWKTQVRPSGVERDLRPAVAPGEVRELGWAPAASAGRRIERLTVIVQAAALNPKFLKIEESTIAMLDQSLGALLQQMPAESVRLLVVSQAKDAVLLRQENFTAADIDALHRALERAQLGTVDYGALLKNGEAGPWGGLAAKEASEASPAAAVIFIGPRRMEPDAVNREPAPASAIRWYYVQYDPPGPAPPARSVWQDDAAGQDPRLPDDPPVSIRMDRSPSVTLAPMAPSGPSQAGDGIERVMRQLNGVRFQVRTPHDLAEAIHRMAGEIPTVMRP